MVAYYEMGLNRGRSGNKAGLFQPYDVFHAKDGWVIIAAVGTPYDRVCGVLGLDPKEEKWQKAHQGVYTPEGLEFDAILRAWAEERTVQQIVDTMNEAQVAACPIMTPEDTAKRPPLRDAGHARGVGRCATWPQGQGHGGRAQVLGDAG